jgi:glycosyltransferase involved in cell wall biosynthesis
MNPFPYYELFDIFVSFSKEESFGLSALEAAALHKPLVCFKNTGGIEELVEQAGNITIPYLDMIKMGQKLIEMQKDSNMLHQLGCDSYLVAQKYEENIVMPQMYNFLKLISEKLINA